MQVDVLELRAAPEVQTANLESFVFDPCTPPRGWITAPLFYKTAADLDRRSGRFGEKGLIRPIAARIRFFHGTIPGEVWERIWAAIPEFGKRNLYVAAPTAKFFTLSPPPSIP